MELRQLRYFAAVATMGSFSRASVHLHIAQSALSRQIQALEEEIGVALIIRSKQGLQLTEAGNLLLVRAMSINDQVHSIKKDTLEYSEIPKGDLRVGTLPTAGSLLVPRALSKLVRSFPEVRVQVHGGMSGVVGEWLRDDKIDVALMHSPWWGTDLITEPLAYAQMVVIISDNQPMHNAPVERKEHYTFHDVTRMPLIMSKAKDTQRILLEREATIRGASLNVVLEADNMATIFAMVQEGVGASVVAYSAIHSLLSQGGVKVFPLVDPVIWADLSIVTSAKRTVTAAMRAYISCVKAESKRLMEREDIPKQYFTLVSPSRT